MIKFNTAAIFSIFIACAGCSNNVNPSHLLKNPNPGKEIVFSGVLPPDFAVSRLKVVYSTESSLPFCNAFSYTMPPRNAIVFVATRRFENTVTAEIQPNKYLSGICHWQMAQVYALLDNDRGEQDNPLIAINYRWYKAHSLLSDSGDQPTDTSIFYCGHKTHDFRCVDGEKGDSSYFPVLMKAGTSHVNFVLRNWDKRPFTVETAP
jgi:hypothetical protein